MRIMGTCNADHAVDRADSPEFPAKLPSDATEIIDRQYVQQLFEKATRNSPQAVALIFEDRQLTYAELNARANQLANYLRERGVGPESIVGLRVERSPEMILGILGILKAGGAYLPVDPAYPAERQQFMIQDAGVQWLLTQSQLPALDHSGKTFRLDSDWPRLAGESTTNPGLINSPDDLAYVIYTSGSASQSHAFNPDAPSLLRRAGSKLSAAFLPFL
jgi:surfactin family lipopeptide synthetase A